MTRIKFLGLLLLLTQVSISNAASLSKDELQFFEDINCTVAIASEFGHRIEDLRAFKGVANGCINLAQVEKVGPADTHSENCRPILERARGAINGRAIPVEEQAITDMCLHTIHSKVLEGASQKKVSEIYLEEVAGNSILRVRFCRSQGWSPPESGKQCVAFYSHLAGESASQK